MSPTWKARLGVILVFVLGCLAGALGVSAFYHHRSAVFFQRGSAAYMDLFERRLDRNLHLDEGQKEQIHEALAENLDKRKMLQAQIRPEVRTLNVQTMQQIRAILRPDQVDTFRQNLVNWRRRFAAPNASLSDATNTDSATIPAVAP